MIKSIRKNDLKVEKAIRKHIVAMCKLYSKKMEKIVLGRINKKK